ncbi:polysaccharide deacetylase family protein, partial [Domibacillus tundrae]
MIDLRFYTANILDVLKKYQIRATIFIVGSEAKKIPG